MPNLSNAGLAVLSGVLLVLAFPDFEFWFLAFIALVPLLFAIEQEKESFIKSFITGWIFGIVFFTGTCWWLTFAPITYGGVPAPLAYLLLLGVTVVAGLFPALFAGFLLISSSDTEPGASLPHLFYGQQLNFCDFGLPETTGMRLLIHKRLQMKYLT